MMLPALSIVVSIKPSVDMKNSAPPRPPREVVVNS